MMTGTQRIKALLDGSPIDRTPIGGWYHMPLVDRNVTDFTRELIASTDLNKWDFIKIRCHTGLSMPSTGRFRASTTPCGSGS